MNRFSANQGPHSYRRPRSAAVSLCCALAILLVVAGDARALPTGFAQTTIDLTTPNAAVAYGPTGQRYVVEAPANFGGSSDIIKIVNADGTIGAPLAVGNATFQSVGGAAWDSVSNRLLITDNFPGKGTLYAVDPLTSQATTLFTGLPAIDKVIVRSTGEILVSDSAGGGAGGVYEVSRDDGSRSPVVSNLDFAAGLAFDSNGDLIVQESFLTGPFSTAGRVYRSTVGGSPGSLTYGAPLLLADNLSASFGLAIDSEDDIYVTGSGGLFKIAAGANAVSAFDGNGAPFQFTTSIAFFAGSGAFEPGGGMGGHLSYIPEFNSSLLIEIFPVPEPGTAILMVIGVAAMGLARSRSRRSLEGR